MGDNDVEETIFVLFSCLFSFSRKRFRSSFDAFSRLVWHLPAMQDVLETFFTLTTACCLIDLTARHPGYVLALRFKLSTWPAIGHQRVCWAKAHCRPLSQSHFSFFSRSSFPPIISSFFLPHLPDAVYLPSEDFSKATVPAPQSQVPLGDTTLCRSGEGLPARLALWERCCNDLHSGSGVASTRDWHR